MELVNGALALGFAGIARLFKRAAPDPRAPQERELAQELYLFRCQLDDPEPPPLHDRAALERWLEEKK